MPAFLCYDKGICAWRATVSSRELCWDASTPGSCVGMLLWDTGAGLGTVPAVPSFPRWFWPGPGSSRELCNGLQGLQDQAGLHRAHGTWPEVEGRCLKGCRGTVLWLP